MDVINLVQVLVIKNVTDLIKHLEMYNGHLLGNNASSPISLDNVTVF